MTLKTKIGIVLLSAIALSGILEILRATDTLYQNFSPVFIIAKSLAFRNPRLSYFFTSVIVPAIFLYVPLMVAGLLLRQNGEFKTLGSASIAFGAAGILNLLSFYIFAFYEMSVLFFLNPLWLIMFLTQTWMTYLSVKAFEQSGRSLLQDYFLHYFILTIIALFVFRIIYSPQIVFHFDLIYSSYLLIAFLIEVKILVDSSRIAFSIPPSKHPIPVASS